MKKIPKAQAGTYKSRTVERNPDNTFKLVTKQKNTPKGEKSSMKEVRTIKGFLKGASRSKPAQPNEQEIERERKKTLETMKAKNGKQMIKRADGSYSQRGLWDNIRAAAKRNKAAGKPGKKPTAAMLKQERKIKAKSK